MFQEVRPEKVELYIVHAGFDLCIQDLWRDRIENSSDSLRPEFSECDVTDLMRFFGNLNLFFFGQIRIRFTMLSPCRGGFRVFRDSQVFFIILSKYGVLLQLIVLRDLLFCYFIILSLTYLVFSRGLLLGILGGVVPNSSPNPDPDSEQKMSQFYTRFQTWPPRNYVIITQIRTPTKQIS